MSDTRCPMPAIGVWRAYPSKRDMPSELPGVSFCRHHDAEAKELLEVPGAHYAHRGEYAEHGGRIQCDVPAVVAEDQAAALDREAITAAQRKVLTHVNELVSLTTQAIGQSSPIGNEAAVLTALLELTQHVNESAAVVARRMAGRTSWARVGAATDITRQAAWERWS